jgi:hypothetical protein
VIDWGLESHDELVVLFDSTSGDGLDLLNLRKNNSDMDEYRGVDAISILSNDL